jgi:hypothetical protein
MRYRRFWAGKPLDLPVHSVDPALMSRVSKHAQSLLTQL